MILKISSLIGGEFHWYWGDFFFLRMGNVELSLTGVFGMLPHPMYTVGYAWTYGCAVLARSYTVFACAMTFHLSQLLFLMLVEVPHVERLYSHESERDETMKTYSWPRRVWELSGIPDFDVTSDVDVTLAMTIVFFITAVSLGSFKGGPLDDDAFFVGLALFWHVVTNVVKTYILVNQEKTKFWTSFFKAKGKDSLAAYRSWQGLFRLLQYITLTSFHLCALRLFRMPSTWMACLDGMYLSQIATGIMLVVIAIWSFSGCYEALGDYGWYYGDFFIPPGHEEAKKKEALEASKNRIKKRSKSKHIFRHSSSDEDIEFSGIPEEESEEESPIQRSHSADSLALNRSVSVNWVDRDDVRPSYNSIYRYINNPEVYLGHLWMYGYALICSSFNLFAVALLSHAMKIAFLNSVETPHLRQVYKQHVRSHTPLTSAIQGEVNKVKSNEKALFLINWVKHPIETGALAPSSKQLARAMCNTMNLGDNSVVVELGPGTGPFTKEILRTLSEHTNTTYLAFELSDEFVELLQSKYPAHKDSFIKESAENIVSELKKRGIDYADTVISGLPWAIFPAELQKGILDEVHRALRPGGRFCTFAYLQGLVLPAGLRFKELLKETFNGEIERSDIVWKNLPPAFVYRCEKAFKL